MFGTHDAESGTVGSDDGKDHERLKPAEQDMIRSVLTLAERPVGSVMTMCKDLVWIDSSKGIEHARERLRDTPHTRVLVSDGELDKLQGVVQSRDMLAGMLNGDAFSLRDYIREPMTLPSTATALEALERIREHPIPLVVIVDDGGRVEGIVTPNDLLAAIAGDLADTRDADHGVAQRADGSWQVDGSMSMDEIERTTGIALPRSPEYDSLSGLFVHELGRLPVLGDVVTVDGWSLTVESLERRHVGNAIIANGGNAKQ